jgi:post-segregation antitoxin (ccd killing protein)
MSKIISISIPDKLHERLQNLKGKINVSKLCQYALTDEVNKKEAFLKRIHKSPKTEKIIARLSKEREESDGLVYERGRKDGEAWAKVAHYDDLYGAVCKEEDEGIIKDGPLDDVEWEILDFVFEKYKLRDDGRTYDEPFQEYLNKVLPVKVHSHNYYSYTIAYRRGWYQAVLDFWNEIKDKI